MLYVICYILYDITLYCIILYYTILYYYIGLYYIILYYYIGLYYIIILYWIVVYYITFLCIYTFNTHIHVRWSIFYTFRCSEGLPYHSLWPIVLASMRHGSVELSAARRGAWGRRRHVQKPWLVVDYNGWLKRPYYWFWLVVWNMNFIFIYFGIVIPTD